MIKELSTDMGKLIVCNILSLDGFFSGPGGDVMVMPFDNGSEGVRAFEIRPPGKLRLLDTRTFDGSSLLMVRYAVEG
jgi:hypothetical protein